MNRTLFLVAAISLAAVVTNSQSIIKEGIKIGMRSVRKASELSSRLVEDLQDLAAAASAELDQEDSGGTAPRAER